MSRQPLIELVDVGREYASSGERVSALRGVTLRIEPGEFVAIVGPSGAGKSTLLNILGLLDAPTGGTYRLGGIDTAEFTEPQRDRARLTWVGFVFQSSFILGERSTAWNVALPLLIAGAPTQGLQARVRELLIEVGLRDRANADGRTLSGGERQRAAIARALANRAPILLADEPSGNLDSANTARLLDSLEELNRAGQTVILITHDPAVAARAQRRIRLLDGTVVAEPSRPAHDDGPADASPRRPSSPPQQAAHSAQPETRTRRTWPTLLRRLLDDVVDGAIARASHTLVLTLAFLLGSAAIVTGIGLSQTAAVQVSERLAVAALDEVRVQARGDVAQARALIEQLPRVRATGVSVELPLRSHPLSALPANVLGDERPHAVIRGVDAGYLEAIGATTEPKSAVGVLDRTGDPVALIGDELLDELEIGWIGPGAAVWVAEVRVSVIGVVRASERDPAAARTVFLPQTVAVQLGATDPTILVRTEPGYPAAVAEAIPSLLNPANPGEVVVETAADLRSLARGVQTDLSAFVTAIGLVIMLLAALSASATMTLSVLSRTPEIALRRAVGSPRSAVAALFVVQGVLLGFVGGALGAAAGSLAIVTISAINQWAPVVSAQAVGVGLGVGLFAGTAASVVPALRAARIEPALALRP